MCCILPARPTASCVGTRKRFRPWPTRPNSIPENILIWLALAWCHKRAGRIDLAIESLEKAILTEPREAILYYNLACYWSLAGNSETALRLLAQSFDIDPSYRDMVADERDFDPIRHLPDFQSLTGVIV